MKQFLATFLVALAVGCGHDHSHDGHDHGHGGHNHGDGVHSHHHDPPNGGSMVEFGKDVVHLEFKQDDENASRINLWAHQFHPPKAVKLTMPEIRVIAKVGDEEKPLVFKPVANPTLGNTAESSSEYAAEADWLVASAAFEARVEKLDFPGGVSHNKTFQFGKKE